MAKYRIIPSLEDQWKIQKDASADHENITDTWWRDANVYITATEPEEQYVVAVVDGIESRTLKTAFDNGTKQECREWIEFALAEEKRIKAAIAREEDESQYEVYE